MQTPATTTPAPATAAPDPRRAAGRTSWLAWTGLSLVALLTVAFVAGSLSLRSHADERRQVMDKLAQIETLATSQSTVVWRALTLEMAEDQHGVIRLRGEEQRGRGAIYGHLEELRELEARGAGWNRLLGFEADPEALDALDDAVAAFLSGTQGAFGQMSLSHQRVRERLRYWDMNFGLVTEALAAVRARDHAIAAASSSWAARVSKGAALLTLLTTALFVLRMGQVRARQVRELQAERMQTLEASEARFRELVQHSSDLILVSEPDGSVRYATPSTRVLAEASLEGGARTTRSLVEGIEASMRAGILDEAEREPAAARWSVEQVLGLSPQELVANVHSEVELRGADGSRRVFDVHAADLTTHADIGGVVLNARDITDRKQLERRLRHQATHDPLTELPNRRCFVERFEELAAATRPGAAVLFIDLDGFKLINDSYGHAAGDQLLVVAASRIGGCLGSSDVLARQGGDEFLALVLEDLDAVVEKILAVLEPPFVVDGHEVFISASVGVVEELAGLDPERAAQRADIAMYAAKQAGKARAQRFDESMLGGASRRLELEADFRRALERGEFIVHYQPKVGFSSARTESLEALVRWEHPTRGFVRPDEFIPFAEESGLISELGQLVLEQACADAVRWQDRGVVVAVNLSPLQFRNPDLIADIAAVLERTGLEPRHLELEITESAVLGDLDNTVRMLNELKELGVRLAIDDFGTGYSNLSHLKHFNVDVLKIDQAFVRGGNPGSLEQLSDAAIVEAVIGMAKAFDLHVVAEGVESASHAAELEALGADLGQGYFYSKPVPAREIDALLAAESHRAA